MNRAMRSILWGVFLAALELEPGANVKAFVPSSAPAFRPAWFTIRQLRQLQQQTHGGPSRTFSLLASTTDTSSVTSPSGRSFGAVSSGQGATREVQDGTVSESDLYNRTLETLDWHRVLEALELEAVTARGRLWARNLVLADSAEKAREAYAAVAELSGISEAPFFGGSMDVTAELDAVARGEVLEVGGLATVSMTLRDLEQLRRWLLEGPAQESRPAPLLKAWGESIVLPEQVVTILADAFDDKNQLSGTKFPRLGELRRDSEALYRRIRSTVESLISAGNGGLGEALAESRFMEVGERFLVPVKPTYKKGLGIVHDASRTGKTVYVEPAQVVEPTNELKELRLALQQEEQRILNQMSVLIAKHTPAVNRALDSAAEVDLCAARLKLGQRLQGAIPTIEVSPYRPPSAAATTLPLPSGGYLLFAAFCSATASVTARRRVQPLPFLPSELRCGNLAFSLPSPHPLPGRRSHGSAALPPPRACTPRP